MNTVGSIESPDERFIVVLNKQLLFESPVNGIVNGTAGFLM